MTAILDIHQHLWPEPFLRALSLRREPPMIVRGGDGWTLRLAGEPDSAVDLADHDPERRAALVRADGLDRALVAPSVPLGIEALPAGEAEPLLAAYHEGVAALPAPLGAWAAVGLAEPDPAALARLLDEGFAGACVAAEALAGPAGYDRLGPILETLARYDAPLFIHPGPAPATAAVSTTASGGATTASGGATTASGGATTASGGAAAASAPPWWAALNHYVAAMQTAWHAFAVWGRPAHPSLRVCFAMLAGLAPLQRERLVARGGAAAADRGAFLDVSSYGTRAIDAVLREVGVDQLVFGSDRPVVAARELSLGDAVDVALRERNPSRLLVPDPMEIAA